MQGLLLCRRAEKAASSRNNKEKQRAEGGSGAPVFLVFRADALHAENMPASCRARKRHTQEKGFPSEKHAHGFRGIKRNAPYPAERFHPGRRKTARLRRHLQRGTQSGISPLHRPRHVSTSAFSSLCSLSFSSARKRPTSASSSSSEPALRMRRSAAAIFSSCFHCQLYSAAIFSALQPRVLCRRSCRTSSGQTMTVMSAPGHVHPVSNHSGTSATAASLP